MNLNELLPQASNKKKKKSVDYLLYIILVEWKWSWEDFSNTPLPIVLSLLKIHEEISKKSKKAKKK